MEFIKQIANVTKYYLNNELLLTITKLDNDCFIVENQFHYIEGMCKNIDDFRTQVKITMHCTKGKNGRLYKTRKLIEHNSKWFTYILQEKGFITKTRAIT